jgi:uncharacterized protein
LFPSGDEEFSLPLQIASAAEKVPDAKIIMGHMGGYFHTGDAILSAEKFENVYLETSAMPYPAVIKEAVNKIGARRILFASDGPGCPPDLELRKIRLAELGAAEEKLILSENIKSILGL